MLDLLLLGRKTAPDFLWDARGGVLPPGATFTRASSAWYFDASGTLVEVGANVPRFCADPSTHELWGYLSEAQSTNGIRNNTMVGAVAGTPGTPPTNWAISPNLGLSSQIVGTGIANGIAYIDIRVSGTTTATGGGYLAVFDTNSSIASAQGQTWTESAYLALVGGSTASLTNIQFDMVSYPGGNDNTFPISIPGITSSLQRFSATYTIANVGNANIQPRISFSANAGVAIDFTLRVGLPQMEQAPSATSPICTTGAAAVTRATDILTMPVASLPGWRPDVGGVLVATYRIHSPRSTSAVATIADAAFTNSIIMYENYANAGVARLSTNSSGLIQLSGAATPAPFVRRKTAGGWGTTVQIAHDGVLDATKAGQIPTSLASLRIGTDDGTDPLNGSIESITYYAGARSDAFVQAVSQ